WRPARPRGTGVRANAARMRSLRARGIGSTRPNAAKGGGCLRPARAALLPPADAGTIGASAAASGRRDLRRASARELEQPVAGVLDVVERLLEALRVAVVRIGNRRRLVLGGEAHQQLQLVVRGLGRELLQRRE